MAVRETDYIQQLANYLKRNLAKGYTIETLRWALVRQGKNRTEVERAIKLAQEQMAASAPKFESKYTPRVESIAAKKEGFFSKILSWFKS